MKTLRDRRRKPTHPGAFLRNVQILQIAFLRQLALAEHVVEVLGDDRPLPPEQLGHLRLSQPDRVVVQAHVEPDLTAWGLLENDLAAGLGRWLRPAWHAHAESFSFSHTLISD